MGLEWYLEWTPSDFFLIWRCWDDRSYFRPWCPVRVGDLILRPFLDFLFLSLFFLFLIRCSSSLPEMGKDESCEEMELILLLCLRERLSKRHRFLFMSSFAWAIFWKFYIVISIICHLISVQIWKKNFYKGSLKFENSFLFMCE